MWRSFRQVLALSLTFLATYFLIKSVLDLSIKDIAELSMLFGYGGLSKPFAQSLCNQRADTVVGFSLMLFSFILQIILLLKPRVDFATNKTGVKRALIATVIIFFIAYGTTTFLSHYWYKQVGSLLIPK